MYRMSEMLSETDSSKPPALLMNNAQDYILYTRSPQMAILPVYHLPAAARHGISLCVRARRVTELFLSTPLSYALFPFVAVNYGIKKRGKK